MARKENQRVIHAGGASFPGGIEQINNGEASDVGGGVVTPGVGVARTFDRMRLPRHVRLTLTGFTIAIAAADDYGGTKLCDLADSNALLLAMEVNLEMVKGAVTNGLEAATDVTIAVGTAVASNSTLSSTMVNVLTGVAFTATDASPLDARHSEADATLTYPIELADAAALALYLNAASSVTADDVLTISGTIDLFFLDMGNVTS